MPSDNQTTEIDPGLNTQVKAVPYPPNGVLVQLGKNPAVPLTKEASLRLIDLLKEAVSGLQ